MANQLVGAAAFIASRLKADTALAAIVGDRVYHDAAPQGAAYPFCLFNCLAATDTLGNDAALIFSRPLYAVRVVVDGNSLAGAQAAANRIDAVLPGRNVAVTIGGVAYQVHGCHREEPLVYQEEAGGKTYTHLGGKYRLHLT